MTVLGTSVAGMDRAEDREKFDDLLTKLNIPRPAGRIATSDKEAMRVASALEFPHCPPVVCVGRQGDGNRLYGK